MTCLAAQKHANISGGERSDGPGTKGSYPKGLQVSKVVFEFATRGGLGSTKGWDNLLALRDIGTEQRPGEQEYRSRESLKQQSHK